VPRTPTAAAAAAAATAVIIAKQEQEEGNYKSAQKMLLETFKDLESQNIPVSRFACVSKSLHEWLFSRRILE
jgi:hypothetical protein